jgi:hypothetical protein
MNRHALKDLARVLLLRWPLLTLSVAACEDAQVPGSAPAGDAAVAGTAQEGSSAAVCTENSECTRYGWPRLVVGVLPSDAGPPLGSVVLTVTGRWPNGAPHADQTGDEEACSQTMYLDPQLLCASQWYLTGGPATLTVSVPGASPWTYTVDIAPHNYCGIDVRYLLLALDESGIPTVVRDELVNPCSRHTDP